MAPNRMLHIVMLCNIIIFACSPNVQDGSINLNADNPLSIFDVFSEVDVIQLETHPEILISDIRKPIYYKGHFYIIDAVSQQIFCFNKDGGFVFKIAAQGKGPGEYNFISDFTIDKFNERLIILDPVFQRILLFDMDGNHIESRIIDAGQVMGYNKVYSINDSIILVTSSTYSQLVFYNYNSDQVIHTEFEYSNQGSLQAFSPNNNVYQFGGRTFALPALKTEVVEVTEILPVPYFNWCFGKHNNNTEYQTAQLTEAIEARQVRYSFPYLAVGVGKIINHHIEKVFENNRYRIAIVEFNNQFKHVVTDKSINQSFTFNYFKEDISLYFSNMQDDCVIMWETHIPARWMGYGIPELNHRRFNYFNVDFLSEKKRNIIENHNPMTDNPFLVIYRFKE